MRTFSLKFRKDNKSKNSKVSKASKGRIILQCAIIKNRDLSKNKKQVDY